MLVNNNHQPSGEVMSDPVTKQDLRDFGVDMKDHMQTCLSPIKDTQDDHELLLRGKTKRNGLVGDMNEIKTTTKNVKIVAGAGGFAGFLALIKTLWES